MPPLLLLRKRRAPILELSPPAVLVLSYAALVLVGTLLLRLPLAYHGGAEWMTALFTAASAVTVTGLSVADTGTHFTLFGQIVILILIQLGGLGFMTVAAFLLSLLGMRMPVRQQIVLGEDLNRTDLGGLLGLVGMIFRVVALFELAGAACLAVSFVPREGWAAGLWSSLFHAVSAFNNAGFSLYPDSLARFAGDPVVNVTVPALLIIGGLGFSVLADLWEERRWRTLTIHSKLMLTGTAGLIVASVALFALLEWTNPDTLGQLAPGARIWASWFQGVTTRTAGFSTVDIARLRDPTALTMIVEMLIGAGSTSTGGGVKVTTFMVLALATIAFLKGRETIVIFGRSLGPEEVLKALALAMLFVAVFTGALFVLLVADKIPFLDLAFETASALGTVGLSRGATGDFHMTGRIVIILVMFIGRVGPLSLGFFLGRRVVPRIGYPSAKVYLG
ncbi:TrkH family potassium uptake protein [Jiella sp. M17.18]|uniref:TrkH family potassium uptake protein n=1 Tax=Jiella sp. M17.18 TaxID=3234247 RepID=UPI0034DF1306